MTDRQIVEKMRLQLAVLKADVRMTYPTAQIFSNAPLALIQCEIAGKINLLESLLGIPLSGFPLKKSAKLLTPKQEEALNDLPIVAYYDESALAGRAGRRHWVGASGKEHHPRTVWSLLKIPGVKYEPNKDRLQFVKA